MIRGNLTFEILFALMVGAIALAVVLDLSLVLVRIWKRRKAKSKRSKMSLTPVQTAENISTFDEPKVAKKKSKLFAPLRLLWKFKWVLINVGLLAFAGFAFYDLFVFPLGVDYHNPKMRAIWEDQEDSFVIQFDRPFDQTKIKHEIYPEIKGKWVYEDNGISFFKRRIRFIPEESILPDNYIQIYIADIKNVMQTKPTWDKVMDFESARAPKVTASYPEDSATDFGIDENIELILDNVDGKYISWEVRIEPEVEFRLVRNLKHTDTVDERKRMEIDFAKPLSQSTQYKLILTKTPQAYNIKTGEVNIKEDAVPDKTITFTTIKAPSISAFEPSGEQALASSKIKIVFDNEMNPDEVTPLVKLEPEIQHTTEWPDKKTLVFTPAQPLAKDTSYKILIPRGIKNLKGGVIEEDIQHVFKTIGAVQVSSYSPSNNTTGRDINTNIVVAFNQDVDKASAQSKFKIDPAVDGKISWEGNKLTFNPNSALSYNKRYTVTVSQGVKSVNGLDSKGNFVFSFTTEPKVFSLNIPFTKQPYRYSCNLTAAKMALGYKGVSVSVDHLNSIAPKQNTPYDAGTNTWGDPNAGFVGDITGGSKGYGMHWNPTATVIRNYRSADVRSGMSNGDLLREVEAGNPVIIWAHNGYAGSGTNTTWNLPGGGSVYTVKGMHSYVVRGYIGDVDNPSSILVSDPGRGNRTLSVSYFNSLWGVFGRKAVVVK